MSVSRMRATILKEFRQFVRDPILLVLVLWLYTIEVVICATALSFELHDEAIGALDLDRSRISREILDEFDRSEMFSIRYVPASEREARALLDAGKARLVVVLPRGFGEHLQAHGGAQAQLLADGTNSLLATTALGQARGLIVESNQRVLRRSLAGRPGPGAQPADRVRLPELQPADADLRRRERRAPPAL